MSSTNISEITNVREALDWLFAKSQKIIAKDIKQTSVTVPEIDDPSVEDALGNH